MLVGQLAKGRSEIPPLDGWLRRDKTGPLFYYPSNYLTLGRVFSQVPALALVGRILSQVLVFDRAQKRHIVISR
jgi:hypothetical protein